MDLFTGIDEPVIELPPWPHQEYGVDAVFAKMAEGVRRIAVTSPTGGGKSRMQFDIAKRVLTVLGEGVTLFANRKMLIEQFIKNLRKAGFGFGVRSANHGLSPFELFQISSIQTEHSRLIKRKTWVPHSCKIIMVDEAHLNENKTATKVYEEYINQGATKIGFTATPVDIDEGYDTLIQAGVTSELRDCGALVPAMHFGCTEPDLSNIKNFQIGEEISENNNVKAIMAPGIHGRVIEWYRRLNPQGLPSIGFGPGVAESFGFAEAFIAAGIPAAHIDGDRIFVNGEWLPSTEESRDKLLEMSRTGKVRIVWNRFVLREAVDMPWLRHGILATVFGSLQSYLQSGGRLLRACPLVDKRNVVVQDHGGNWWRHGSLNSDRVWSLDANGRMIANARADDISGDNSDGEPKQPEPFLCKECNTVLVLRNIMRNFMARCPRCGHEMDFRRRSRPVIQANGELVEHPGNIFVRRKVELRPDTQERWRQYYFRAKNSKMTFAQAAGLFFYDNGYYPPRSLPLMPTDTLDWYRQVRTVPFVRLRKEEKRRG